jgi:heterodisulfide reductase subunit A-like polyferredoxin
MSDTQKGFMEKDSVKKTGAVLVLGGGIAGIQASLDLANSGFRVYLVERGAAIGGMMSHLDKTFPTGDCATCIISPKLAECSRHENIEIITLAELAGLKGEPGNFTATIKRHPRYIDEEKCTACGQCSEVCPVKVSNDFDRGLGTRPAVAKHYAQATPNKYEILKNGHSPCRIACPAGVNVQGYVQLIKKGEYLKAVNLIRERNPLAAICGRVCTHPCEAACTRASLDGGVAIRLLKRFAADREMEMVASGKLALPVAKTPSPGAKRVAVIGAGPAGLTAADDLAGRGLAVTVYEAGAAAGGMLRRGIPAYRLPGDVLDHEVELIRRKGVQFIYNCRVGQDITLERLRQENEAVFIGVGVQSSRKLGVEGEAADGVLYGVEFLGTVGTAAQPVIKDRVVVIGGGNVAVDVARTARRLGASQVEMVSLEQREEMPALPEEVAATLEEGIVVRNGWGPRRILGNGSVSGIELKKCVRVFDEQKRFSPVYDENILTELEADQVIVAIGQSLEKGFAGATGLPLERGSFQVDPVTLETPVKGVFAGGDSVSGAASVVGAVAAGKRAAESIARYLTGADMRAARPEDNLRPLPEDMLPKMKGRVKQARALPGMLPLAQRTGGFTEVESGLSEAAALAECERCLNCALCSECRECVAACEQHAIDHNMKERETELAVGAVILAPGFEEFDAAKKGEFGFGRYPNVLTSVQFERMLSASGPFDGRVIRRSDGAEARRIAWVQCVGSRDEKCGNDYCSSVCCMVSTKQALVATDHQPGLQAAVFYMDIRAHGKDFDQYYERARAQGNIDYIKAMPSRVMQLPGKKELRLRYYEGNKVQERDFDLVVLSVGMEPPAAAVAAARRLGIETNVFDFCATGRLAPLNTSRPGVFVAGAFQEPKDIPETVTQASAAASLAMELLAPARHSLQAKKAYPGEHDVTDETPRVGVFICHCGKNIASVVDVEKVVAAAAAQPGVAFATHTMYTCSDTTLTEIKNTIRDYRLNRIVVASCTPRTHEPIFRDTLREAGLNPYLFELANIRDQCSWVHSDEPEAATAKAIGLVKMSIARARLLKPLQGTAYTVEPGGLVIGGGVAGMTAALALADQGFSTHLVEKTDRLGGNFLTLGATLEGDDIAAFGAGLIDRVRRNPNINLHLGTEVSGISGFIGQFQTTLAEGGQEVKVPCGAIIVATGAGPAETTDFMRGRSDRVMNQLELEKRLGDGSFRPEGGNIVMIQCAGSRGDERAYCSRVCCSMAVKNALRLKKISPAARIFVLYRDIRTYGFRETYYQEARRAGIIFIRYAKEKPPEVSPDVSGLLVAVDSPDFPEPIEIEADNVVLSTGIAPNQGNRRLADMLKVPVNRDGFFVEAHLKLRPIDFATEGIFLCGLAHSPKMVDENISQAKAAAARAATVLSRSFLEVGAEVSHIDQDKCISCLTCVRACPYSAPFVNIDGKAEVAAAKCMGCGICAAECPAHAIQRRHFNREQISTMLDEMMGLSGAPTPGLAEVVK